MDKVLANLAEWLSSKKTKSAITASLPLIVAGVQAEMPWWQVAVGLAGIWSGAMGAQALADVGKERAKIEAASRAELSASTADESADALLAELK